VTITFSCDCGRAIAVPASAAGKMVQCPGCGDAVRVPYSSTAVSATPSAPLGRGPRAIETTLIPPVHGSLIGALLAGLTLSLFHDSGSLGAAGWAALGAGGIAGAILLPAVRDREVRGKAGAILMGGAIGVALGIVAGASLTLAFIGSPRALMPAFAAPIVVGAVVGGILGRIRHGRRFTIAEVSAWVAAVACALAIVRELMS
jgi:hypothetical protein